MYEEDHQRFPDKTFLGSENSHSDEAWQAVTEHPYICGQFLWTGIDYLGEAKGWPVHGSPAGLLTTAGFPKPGYERRKALWLKGGVDASKEERENARGVQTEKPVSISACLWQEKDLISGANWEDAAGQTGYLYQILVRLVDGNGNKVVRDDQEVKAQVQGSGQLAGIDNGNLADVTPFSEESRKTFHGDLAVYVRRMSKGPIRVFLQPSIDGKEGETLEFTLGGTVLQNNAIS